MPFANCSGFFLTPFRYSASHSPTIPDFKSFLLNTLSTLVGARWESFSQVAAVKTKGPSLEMLKNTAKGDGQILNRGV